MSTLSLRLPESIRPRLTQLTDREGIAITQLINSAVAEKLAALLTEEYLRQRAKRGSRKTLREVLAKVPDVEPEEHDRNHQLNKLSSKPSALCVLVATFLGCTSSGDVADSRSRQMPEGDAGHRSTTDAGHEPSGFVDATVDSDADASDSSARLPTCDPEPQPVALPSGEPQGGLARVPLKLLCDGACARAQTDFFAHLTCGEFDDAGVDLDSLDDAGGLDGPASSNSWSWLRNEGCGTIQYSTMPPAWPRYFNFDSSTGVLIGAIRGDDVPYTSTIGHAKAPGGSLEPCASRLAPVRSSRSATERKRCNRSDAA